MCYSDSLELVKLQLMILILILLAFIFLCAVYEVATFSSSVVSSSCLWSRVSTNRNSATLPLQPTLWQKVELQLEGQKLSPAHILSSVFPVVCRSTGKVLQIYQC